ncbi:nitroreductase family protein [bacterium]|nr:nitroreductase family protein [bacterium]
MPFQAPPRPEEGPLEAVRDFRQWLDKRRSLRFFSSEPVERAVIEELILAAGTAPSGAHKQPWTFVAVSDPHLKTRIREAAETEERAFYAGRASESWLRDLAPLGTDWQKPFLEDAPWLIVVFRQAHAPDGSKHYYTQESVGMACGLLIAAIHKAGLVTLTHTPSPMQFLSEVLGRPANEKPYVLLPIGYPAPQATVPDLVRKPLDELAVFFEAGAQ